MPTTTDMLLLALAVLVSVVIAARTYMAWQRLTASAARVRGRTVAMDERAERLAGTLAAARARAGAINAEIEWQRTELAGFDRAIERRTRDLVARRQWLDEVRARGIPDIRRMVNRLRTTARVVEAALKLRRSFG